MPAAIPILAVTGGAAVIGGAAAAAIGLGTVGAVAATAIGTGIVAGGITALEGGDVSDVLKSAVVGGAASYVGGSVGDILGGATDTIIDIPTDIPVEVPVEIPVGTFDGASTDIGNAGGLLDEVPMSSSDLISKELGIDASNGLLGGSEVTPPPSSGYYNEITGEFIPDVNGPLQGPLTDASGTNIGSMDGYTYDRTTDTWLTPDGQVYTPTIENPVPPEASTKSPISVSDALRAAGLVSSVVGAGKIADSLAGTAGNGAFDIVPVPSDWKSPPPTSVAEFTPLAPIDFGNKEMLRGTQWEKLLSPTYGQTPPMPTMPNNPSNMTFDQLTKILGGSRESIPSANLSINDVIAGIQSQYGQTPQGSMGQKPA